MASCDTQMDDTRYIVAEFKDGLQLIPALWFNGDTSTSIWPSHLKTKQRINKAIMTREVPKEHTDWEELPVNKVFGTASNYAEGLQKLCLAEDTSNVDETGMSSSEIREREKQRRRKKAKRRLSSSGDESYSDKENDTRYKLPVLPKKQQFVSTKCHEILRTSEEDTSNIFENALFNNGRVSPIEDHVLCTDESKTAMFSKLNRILYKLDSIENKVDICTAKLQSANKTYNEQRSDIRLPIRTLSQLTLFEEQLQDVTFKEDVLHTFQLIGGHNVHVMLRNVLKTAIADTLVTQFNWNGRKNKRCFKDLEVTKLIIQAIRISYTATTDKDIAEYVSKWLAQASVRIARLKEGEKESHDDK
ncbi:PREDICTED: uncharacterized protein LOC105556509 isoform X2 [Vollenhovia emeryi]|uniref:uncharacterized protein LOC105556509 isoform X2 n=1 Tax=Vollenhovia emeryi TaxID=411798 RepID=UPI0005F4DE04|nr:PREDICTED: uncharacterized protein LOC105556509 isoform X2 [Vollenhovia emeryi]